LLRNDPAHIQAIAAAVASCSQCAANSARDRGGVAGARSLYRIDSEESLLDRVAQGKRVIICELDPPKTLAWRSFSWARRRW
jgi:hypothetical protein